jgi:hypothetical protein
MTKFILVPINKGPVIRLNTKYIIGYAKLDTTCDTCIYLEHKYLPTIHTLLEPEQIDKLIEDS